MKKILSGFLLSLLVMAWPVMASENTKPTTDTQSSFFIVAHNSPVNPRQMPKTASSCIEFAKAYLGRSGEKWGNANQIQPIAEKPYVGGLVLTNEGRWGHVAVIINITGNSLRLIEGNWIAGQVSTRSLDINSQLIRGFK